MADTLSRAFDLLRELSEGDWWSYEELTRRHGIGRRTAQRWIAALRESFDESFEARLDDEGRVQFRFSRLPFRFFEAPSPDELAALEFASEVLDRERIPERKRLHSLRQKIEKAQRDRRNAEQEDIEARLGTLGFVSRPGPRITVGEGVRRQIEDALVKSRVVEFEYTGVDGTTRRHVMEPRGLLFGGAVRLVASPEGKDEPLYQYRLDRIREVEVTERGSGQDPEPFLEYVRHLFGSFQDQEVTKVEWRFRPEAPGVGDWEFHPSQKREWNDDGSLTVRFEATGKEDMARHIIGWWEWIEHVEPESLRKVVLGMRLAGLAPLLREFGGADIAERVEELAAEFRRGGTQESGS